MSPLFKMSNCFVLFFKDMKFARPILEMIIVIMFVMICDFPNTFFFSFAYFTIECENGTYENGCQTECINCLNVTQCQLLNGTCSYGCKPGYQGPECDRSKFSRTLCFV